MPRSRDQQVGRLGCGYQKPASFKSVPHQRTKVSQALCWGGHSHGSAQVCISPEHTIVTLPFSLPPSHTHQLLMASQQSKKVQVLPSSPHLKVRKQSFEVTYPCYVARAVEPGYEPGSRALKTVLLAAWSAYVVSDTRLASSLTHPPDTLKCGPDCYFALDVVT